MSRVLTYTVPPEQDGRKVRSILQGPLGLSAGLVTRLKQRDGAVCLNGNAARTIDTVRAGDILTAEVGDTRAGGLFAPMDRKPDILFEDEDLLILNKSAGMATHGKTEKGECTVANMLSAYLGTAYPFHPVNRLDRGTTGVMCVAKSGYAHNRARLLLHSPDFRREYLAIAVGEIKDTEGVIDAPIMKIADKKFGVRPGGAPSVTEYRVLSVSDGLTLLRVLPRSGRTHQIRVHMAYIGHPLLGDRLYGGISDELSRPALHSRSLCMTHPVTGEPIGVTAPVPADLLSVMERHGLSLD